MKRSISQRDSLNGSTEESCIVIYREPSANSHLVVPNSFDNYSDDSIQDTINGTIKTGSFMLRDEIIHAHNKKYIVKERPILHPVPERFYSQTSICEYIKEQISNDINLDIKIYGPNPNSEVACLIRLKQYQLEKISAVKSDGELATSLYALSRRTEAELFHACSVWVSAHARVHTDDVIYKTSQKQYRHVCFHKGDDWAKLLIENLDKLYDRPLLPITETPTAKQWLHLFIKASLDDHPFLLIAMKEFLESEFMHYVFAEHLCEQHEWNRQCLTCKQ